MEKVSQLKLFRKLFLKEDDEGFSLIELVVVVSVLAVLAAIALPTFNCITRKSKATSALAALRQIKTECAVKREAGDEIPATFLASNLQGYEIESDGSNSCDGNQSSGLIRAIPNDQDQLPTFILATNSNELTYSFRGQTGTNFSDCLGLICQTSQSFENEDEFAQDDPWEDPISGPCLDIGLDKRHIISCQLHTYCMCTERYEEIKIHMIDVFPDRDNFWDSWENGDTFLEENYELCGIHEDTHLPNGTERWCPKGIDISPF